MISRVIFLTIVIEIAVSIPAFAQDTSIAMDYRGVSGRWFPRQMVDQMQMDLQELDALRKIRPALESKLDVRMKRIEDLRLALDATSQALDVSTGAVKTAEDAMSDAAQRAVAAEKRAMDAEEHANKWYRHPALWCGVGVVLTVVVEIIVFSAI